MAARKVKANTTASEIHQFFALRKQRLHHHYSSRPTGPLRLRRSRFRGQTDRLLKFLVPVVIAIAVKPVADNPHHERRGLPAESLGLAFSDDGELFAMPKSVGQHGDKHMMKSRDYDGYLTICRTILSISSSR